VIPYVVSSIEVRRVVNCYTLFTFTLYLIAAWLVQRAHTFFGLAFWQCLASLA